MYPGLEDELVIFSIRYPNIIVHKANKLCKIEEPHNIKDCKLWYQ